MFVKLAGCCWCYKSGIVLLAQPDGLGLISPAVHNTVGNPPGVEVNLGSNLQPVWQIFVSPTPGRTVSRATTKPDTVGVEDHQLGLQDVLAVENIDLNITHITQAQGVGHIGLDLSFKTVDGRVG